MHLKILFQQHIEYWVGELKYEMMIHGFILEDELF